MNVGPPDRRRHSVQGLAALATWLVLLALAAGCSTPEPRPPRAGASEAPAVAPAPIPTHAASPDRGELLPDPDFADGARGWELVNVQPQADLGPDDGPALALKAPPASAAGEGQAATASVTIAAPAGRPVRFALAVQPLAGGGRIGLTFTPLAADGSEAGQPEREDQRVEGHDWRRHVWRYDVPPGTARLRLDVELRPGHQALVARASLMVEDYELPVLDTAGVTRLTQLIAPDVERLRGRLFRHPVPVVVVDDAEARSYFEERIDRFWPADRREADEIAYRQLGVWPSPQPMLEAMLALMKEQAGGFYDPQTDTFTVLGDMPRSAAPIIIAHELTHALDDQAFDLDGHIAALMDDSDRASAYGAVVEGSGTVIMSQYMGEMLGADRLSLTSLAEIKQTDAGQGEALKSAPPYLSRALLFSYTMGMNLLLRGKGQSALGDLDPADIDRAFQEPPRSSEQVLHPDAYWVTPDEPRAVALPDLSATLGPGWTLRRSDTLGEVLLPILTGGGAIDVDSMEVAAPFAWTSFATAGWGGDLWQLYEAPGAGAGGTPRHVTVLGTVWDTPEDAEQFAAALTLPEGSQVERRGAAVVVVAGAQGQGDVESAALASAALDAITPR